MTDSDVLLAISTLRLSQRAATACYRALCSYPTTAYRLTVEANWAAYLTEGWGFHAPFLDLGHAPYGRDWPPLSKADNRPN